MNRILNSTLFAVFFREIKRFTSSKVLLFSTFIAPVLSFVLIAWIFSAGVVRDLPVTIVDQDHSALSRNIIRLVEATPIANTSKAMGLSEAHGLMLKGKTEGILYIPEKMERNVIAGNSPELALYINNANIVKGGLLYSGLYKTLSSISIGISIRMGMISGMTESEALIQSHPIQVDSHLLFNPFANYDYFLSLGVLPLMVVILTFLVSVYVIGTELKYGTSADLMDHAQGSIFIALVGKMLPYTIMFYMNAMCMNIILFHFIQIPLTGNIIVLLFAEFLLIICYQMLAIFIMAITANLRLSLSLGSAYTMMALTFAGVTFPTMAMPIIAKIVSWFFPYTFWIKIFLSQTIRNQPLRTIIPDFLILLIFIVISLCVFPVMKRKMLESKYWGRS